MATTRLPALGASAVPVTQEYHTLMGLLRQEDCCNSHVCSDLAIRDIYKVQRHRICHLASLFKLVGRTQQAVIARLGLIGVQFSTTSGPHYQSHRQVSSLAVWS
jgi:hypothetical protein